MCYALIVFAFIAYSIGIFFIPWWWVIMGLACAQVLLMLLTRCNIWRAVKSMLYALPFIALTFAFNYWLLDLNDSLLFAARLGLVVHLTFILSQKLSVLNFARGIEVLLWPLRIFRLNTRHVSLVMAIAVSFIPVLRDQYIDIRAAMNARGRRRGLSLFMRLFMFKIIYRASVLALTLEAKGYA